MDKNSLFPLIVLVYLSSCSNSLDMVDPIDPIPVVYFQLDPTDSIHYLTLTRTFVGEVSALEIARDPDFVFYDSADVRLEGWEGQYKIWETQFTLSDRTKEPGIFPDVPGYCYESKPDVNGILETIDSFRLIIKIPGIPHPAFSRIPVMSEVVVPRWYDHEIALYPDGYQFKQPGCFGARYSQVLCEFHYQEYDGTWLDRSVTFQLKKNSMASGNIVYPDLFFNQLVKTLTPYEENNNRRFISIDLIFLYGDQFYKDYIETYENSGNQDLPLKGNINDGFGLFTMKRESRYEDLHLDQESLDSLSRGHITKKLKFVGW